MFGSSLAERNYCATARNAAREFWILFHSQDTGTPLQPFSAAPCLHDFSPAPKRAPGASGCSPPPVPSVNSDHIKIVQADNDSAVLHQIQTAFTPR